MPDLEKLPLSLNDDIDEDPVDSVEDCRPKTPQPQDVPINKGASCYIFYAQLHIFLLCLLYMFRKEKLSFCKDISCLAYVNDK